MWKSVLEEKRVEFHKETPSFMTLLKTGVSGGCVLTGAGLAHT